MKTKASKRLLCVLLAVLLALPVLLTVSLRASAFDADEYTDKPNMTVVESVVKRVSDGEPVYDEIIYSGRLYTGGKSNTGDSYVNQTYHVGAGFLFKDDVGDICWATCGTAGAAAPASGQAYLTFEHMATVIGDNFNNLAQGRNGPHYIVDAANNDPTWGSGMNLDASFVFRCFYYAEKHQKEWNLINDTNCYLQEAITIAYRHEWDTRLIKYGNVGKVNGKTWVENSPSSWTEDKTHFNGVVSSTIGTAYAEQIIDAANEILRYATEDADGIKDELVINDSKYSGGVSYTDSSGVVRTLRRTSAPVKGMQSLFVYKGDFEVEPLTYSIDLTKVDKDNNAITLSGATFALYKKNGTLVGSKTTGSSGKISWTGLEAGDYYIEEAKAPDGYVKFSSTINITLPGSGYSSSGNSSTSYQIRYTDGNASVTVNEVKAKGDLKIKKVDIKGNPIKGVTFGLYSSSGQNGHIRNETTGDDGYATFTDLAPGTYYLHELSAPSGYKVDTNKEYTGTVVSGTTKEANGGNAVENPPSSYSIEVVKKRAGGDFAYLSGVTFTLYKQDSSGSYTFDGRRYAFCKTGTTNSSGKINWTGLEEGDYCYVETSVPRGVELDTTKHYVSFPKDGNGLGKYTKYIDNDPEIYWTPQVEKNLSKSFDTAGEPEANFGEFSFVLQKWNGSSWDLVEQKYIVGSGDVTFSEIAYGRSDVGTHTYRVYEEKGDNERVSYDDQTIHIVTFTVTVTLRRPTASYEWDRLEISTSVSSNQHPASTSDTEKTTFINYVPSGSWKANISKVLIGRKLTDKEFTFTLEKWVGPGEDDWTLLQTVKCREDHVVPFASYYYTLADAGPNGTVKQHVYRVREVDTHDPTVIYDEHTVTYTVSVSYDRKNETALTITVDVSSSEPGVVDEGEITTFTNYVPVEIKIEKVDPNGKTLAGAEFCLQWSEDGKSWANVKYTAEIEKGGCENADVVDGKLTTDDDGKIAYERLYPGLHYRLTETKAPDGMQLLAETAYEGVLPPDAAVTNPDTALELHVVNQPVFTLPATGGHGFWNVALAVPLLCVSIALLLFVGKKKRKS